MGHTNNDAVAGRISEYIYTAIEATRLGIQTDTDTVVAIVTGNILATIETQYQRRPEAQQ